jgi:hypothetical protein
MGTILHPNRGLPSCVSALLGATVLLSASCASEPELETRTFELRHLQPAQAQLMVEPYVYQERSGAPGRLSVFDGGVTVRETPENLERIARVLEERDRARPGVTLHFQLIEGDGPGEADPRIEEVERVLRDLFRFEGYRLLAETQIGAMEGGTGVQGFRTPDGESHELLAQVRRVSGTAERGSVEVEVRLVGAAVEFLESRVTIPAGQTVVLGSTQMDPEKGAVILTVRPELVP